MSSWLRIDDSISPISPLYKRPSSPIPELERPTKRLQLGPSSSTATLVEDYVMGNKQTKQACEEDDGDEDVDQEMDVTPKKDKGKAKAKMVLIPDLPQEIWSRVFEFLYIGCEDRESEPHTSFLVQS